MLANDVNRSLRLITPISTACSTIDPKKHLQVLYCVEARNVRLQNSNLAHPWEDMKMQLHCHTKMSEQPHHKSLVSMSSSWSCDGLGSLSRLAWFKVGDSQYTNEKDPMMRPLLTEP